MPKGVYKHTEEQYVKIVNTRTKNSKKWKLTDEQRRKHAMFGDKNPAKRIDVKIKISNTVKKQYQQHVQMGFQKGNKFGERNRGENHHNWQGGKSFSPYPLGWNRTFREQIRYRDGYKCQFCGCHEVDCKRKLHIHHIDYNKININLENLISLCQSCHMKTNYSREYWLNFFANYKIQIEKKNYNHPDQPYEE